MCWLIKKICLQIKVLVSLVKPICGCFIPIFRGDENTLLLVPGQNQSAVRVIVQETNITIKLDATPEHPFVLSVPEFYICYVLLDYELLSTNMEFYLKLYISDGSVQCSINGSPFQWQLRFFLKFKLRWQICLILLPNSINIQNHNWKLKILFNTGMPLIYIENILSSIWGNWCKI